MLCLEAKMHLKNFYIYLIFASYLFSQTPYPDSVVSVNYGPGAGFGQQYFPQNILGYPSSQASPIAPANLESDLLSLGTGGSITLQFIDNEIYNGPGADFSVFENVFYIAGDTNKPFIETALVEISVDGSEWYAFSYDTITGDGLAGLKPTKGDGDPMNPLESGGDQFDLDSLKVPLSQIRFVRLTDTDTLFQDRGASFDLDAVVGIHSRAVSSLATTTNNQPFSDLYISNYPNPFNSETTLLLKSLRQKAVHIRIYNTSGQKVMEEISQMLTYGINRLRINISSKLASGTYLVQIIDSSGLLIGSHKLVHVP
jgi:hypothetical protein